MESFRNTTTKIKNFSKAANTKSCCTSETLAETIESGPLCTKDLFQNKSVVEFVTGGVELVRAILHGYAGGLILMK